MVRFTNFYVKNIFFFYFHTIFFFFTEIGMFEDPHVKDASRML